MLTAILNKEVIEHVPFWIYLSTESFITLALRSEYSIGLLIGRVISIIEDKRWNTELSNDSTFSRNKMESRASKLKTNEVAFTTLKVQ